MDLRSDVAFLEQENRKERGNNIQQDEVRRGVSALDTGEVEVDARIDRKAAVFACAHFAERT